MAETDLGPCQTSTMKHFERRLNGLCGASKGFMKALKSFIKPFKTPQRLLIVLAKGFTIDV